MAFRALILGASGYGGGELLRYLSVHPECEGVSGTSRRFAGQPFHSAHPNMLGFVGGVFSAEPDLAWLAESEQPVVFSAQPHGVFARSASAFLAACPVNVLAIDLSADHRIQDATIYAKYYGDHPNPSEPLGWTYGLVEQNRPVLSNATRIACPGCFATAVQLALLPFLDVDLDHVCVAAATGSSGSGMEPSATTHHPTRANDYRAYKPLKHQHLAEVEQLVAGRFGVSFVPHSAPMVRGIFATAQFRTSEDAAGLVTARFGDEPFVRLLDGTPRVLSVVGTNFAEIAVAQEGENVAVMIAVDNLGKGMAGQAIQALNVALGYPEATGLRYAGPYPV